jgi:hypothetical protein
MNKGVMIRVGVGDAYAMIASEGTGYSPDWVHDMSVRAYTSLQETLRVGIESGYIQMPDSDDDIDEIEESSEDSEEDTEEVGGFGNFWLQ